MTYAIMKRGTTVGMKERNDPNMFKSHFVESFKKSIPDDLTTEDLLEAASEIGVTLDLQKQKYYPGRKIDREEVFKKLFKGEQLSHEEMFSSRGYRGLNILPYPKHVK